MSEVSERYRRLSDQFAARIAAVPAGAWDDPTPCEEWTVRDLVRHVVATQGMFLGFVGKEQLASPSVDDDPVGAWDAARAGVQHELDDPVLAGAEFDGLLGRTTFEAAVDRFLDTDLVVHGWDLARATGQDEHIDPEDAGRVLECARGLGDTLRSHGAAGPEVPVPADADVQTRLIAFFGRRP